MNNKKLLRRSYQKKFNKLKPVIIDAPAQGWLKTIREFFGMTTNQLAKRLGVSQPRVIYMEKNESNLKISTMQKIADTLNCDFIYTFVPRQNIDDVLHEQAKFKAMQILENVNQNMGLEKQLYKSDELTQDIIEDLLNGNISKIWDE